MFDTKIVTSVSYGTTIHMDACDTLAFMRGIAITLISHCESVRIKERHGVLETEANNGRSDFYLEKYCAGVHGAVLNNIYRQFADILYEFVEECVKNGTVRGLYLFREKSNSGIPGYKLITLALETYDNLINREYEILGENRPYNFKNFTLNNEVFENMMEEM